MKVLNDVCLLAADTGRARAYLDIIQRAGLIPAYAVLIGPGDAPVASASQLATPLFDNITPLSQALKLAGVSFTEIATDDINAPEVCKALAAHPASIAIFAGPPGAIVRAPLFAVGKKFLHAHPGQLPDYRGSTPMYYSLLAEGKLTVSVIFLERDIDRGPILATMDFPPPDDRAQIDLAYDPWMRAALLAQVLHAYSTNGKLEPRPQSNAGGMTFFVIHPVLKHLAILANPLRQNTEAVYPKQETTT
jgi:methionyl-tRNA formyltransferase